MSSSFPALGHGIGLRTKHYGEIVGHWPKIDWLEVISENFMVRGGRPIDVLRRVRERYPVVLHGVSLSIGSVDPLNRRYLRELASLVGWVEPAWVSDHLCWTGIDGWNAHDLLPLPYTEETLFHVVRRVDEVQEVLGRPLVLENVSSYLRYVDSEMEEWEFLSAVSARSGAFLLLDVNNVYVSSRNHGFDPVAYLKGLPSDRVVQYHLAGHRDHGSHLVDTHDRPISDPVWALYAEAIRRIGPRPTLIERDDEIPALGVLLRETEQARAIEKAIHGEPRGNPEAPPAAHHGA